MTPSHLFEKIHICPHASWPESALACGGGPASVMRRPPHLDEQSRHYARVRRCRCCRKGCEGARPTSNQHRLTRLLMSEGLVAEVMADVTCAVVSADDPVSWICDERLRTVSPMAAEVWVFNSTLDHVVLVEHRWRGWVPPGGAAEQGESPRRAAQRELAEEAGLVVDLEPRPAVASRRSFRDGWTETLALTYVAVTARTALTSEPGQICSWWPLNREWSSRFPDDRTRMLEFLRSRSAALKHR
jgi:8-oxo-dGTP diphosphatase